MKAREKMGGHLVHVCRDYLELSRELAAELLSQWELGPDGFWCLASGESPRGAYQCMAELLAQRATLASELRVCPLDEWCVADSEFKGSCERFISDWVVRPWGVRAERYFSFSAAASPEGELVKMRRVLSAEGDFDLCVLGVGQNGHIGFIEPATDLPLSVRKVFLSSASLSHPMVAAMKEKPVYGLTMGLGEIFRAKTVVVVVTGEGKGELMRRAWHGGVSTVLPVSLLKLHPNVCWYFTESIARVVGL